MPVVLVELVRVVEFDELSVAKTWSSSSTSYAPLLVQKLEMAFLIFALDLQPFIPWRKSIFLYEGCCA